MTCGVVGDSVDASRDGVQVGVDCGSSEGGVFFALSACFWERGRRGVIRFFLLWGTLFSRYLSNAILLLGNWRRSDFSSHAPLHATLNGMERIGMSSFSGWTMVRWDGISPEWICLHRYLAIIWVGFHLLTW